MGRLATLVQVALVLLLASEGRGQLAITEVMPVSRWNTNSGFHGAEYWELTNFGTNEVNLNGYGFRDANPFRALRKEPFTNLVIAAGESVIFFRIEFDDQAVTTPAHFRAWWGDAKLPPNLQCRTYERPGLSAWDGDAVWLCDDQEQVVDGVQFGRARVGRAFTYDPATGLFGVFSSPGVDGAFSAELADDVGSPGTTVGPVAVRLLEQPKNQSADLGMTVILSALAGGLPRPHYQWFANDTVLPGATGASLTLSNLDAFDAGAYHVVVTNSLSGATSQVANVTVNTQPTPPSILIPPADAAVFTRQTAVFSVSARGVPPPAYHWQVDGANLNGAGPRLEIADATVSLSGARVSVVVSNGLGTASASARLTVTRRPDLRFTEVFVLPNNAAANRQFGWFELTNFDTNTVDLTGWRFSDEPALSLAVTITNALTVAPGESVVFAERLDLGRFAAWWGGDHLPGDFKLYPYSGFELDRFGDTLFLWNPAARDPHADVVSSVSWAAATAGVSFECENFYDAEYGCIGSSSGHSVIGVRGGFRAAEDGDIGSPGYLTNPALEIISVSNGAKIAIRCRVVSGRTYRLQRTSSLASGTWTSLPGQVADNNVLALTDVVPEPASTWFYRVEQMP